MDWNKLAEFIKKFFWMGGLAAVAYMGEHGNDGGFIRDVWGAAKTASPFAAMFAVLVWADERRERREAQKQCNERTIDFIRAANVQAQASDKMGSGVRELSDVIRDIQPERRRRR